MTLLMNRAAEDDVGGGVQIGMATQEGFELHFDAYPFTLSFSRLGDPPLTMKYRGFDLEKISQVGNAFVTLRGLQG